MPEAVVPEVLGGVKALLFDVFGTVVDWRSSIHQELVTRAREKLASDALGSSSSTPPPNSTPSSRARFEALTEDDWAKFAQEWRDSYGVFTKTFVPGETEWKDIDTHHYDSLIKLLEAWGISGIYSDDEIRSLSLCWHFLTPWEDSSAGIKALGSGGFVTSTLSNGNRSLLRDLQEYGDLGFREIISSADFGAYKPHPRTYLGAARTLDLQPEQVAMVAAHLGDLAAARSNGLRTIYVERPREEAWGPDEPRYQEARQWVDIWVSEDEGGFVEVAKRLGVPDN